MAYNYVISNLFYAIGTLATYFIGNFYLYCIVILIYGIFDGLYLCSVMKMAYETTGSSKLVNQAIGYFNSMCAITLVIGPITSGDYIRKIL